MLTSWKSSKCKLNATLPFILRKWTSQGDLGKFQSSLGHICSKAWMGYKKTKKIMQLDTGMRPCGPGLQLHLSVCANSLSRPGRQQCWPRWVGSWSPARGQLWVLGSRPAPGRKLSPLQKQNLHKQVYEDSCSISFYIPMTYIEPNNLTINIESNCKKSNSQLLLLPEKLYIWEWRRNLGKTNCVLTFQISDWRPSRTL